MKKKKNEGKFDIKEELAKLKELSTMEDFEIVEKMFLETDERARREEEEQKKKTYYVLFLAGSLLIITYFRECLPIAAFGMWLLWLSCIPQILKRNVRLAYEKSKQYYSEQECMIPQRMKFLFPFVEERDEKGIPKDIFWAAVSVFCGYVIGTGIALIGMYIRDMRMYGFLFAVVMGDLLLIYAPLLNKAEKRPFYAKFKSLNLHNWKYRMFDGLKDEPSAQPAGECEIILVEKRRKKRTYVTVRMQNGEIKHHVLASPELIENERHKVYTLWCLCRVYWI